MLKLLLIPTLFWFSYSVRTPRERPNPLDHEVSIGWENQHYQFSCLTEQENGNQYDGHRLWVRWTNWLESEIFYKEAYDVSSQSLRALYQPFPEVFVLKCLKVGGTINTNDWQEPALLGNISWKSDKNFLAYETNFVNRVVVSCKLGWEVPLGKRYFVEPYLEYRSIDDNEIFWNKFIISWKKN